MKKEIYISTVITESYAATATAIVTRCRDCGRIVDVEYGSAVRDLRGEDKARVRNLEAN